MMRRIAICPELNRGIFFRCFFFERDSTVVEARDGEKKRHLAEKRINFSRLSLAARSAVFWFFLFFFL